MCASSRAPFLFPSTNTPLPYDTLSDRSIDRLLAATHRSRRRDHDDYEAQILHCAAEICRMRESCDRNVTMLLQTRATLRAAAASTRRRSPPCSACKARRSMFDRNQSCRRLFPLCRCFGQFARGCGLKFACFCQHRRRRRRQNLPTHIDCWSLE